MMRRSLVPLSTLALVAAGAGVLAPAAHARPTAVPAAVPTVVPAALPAADDAGFYTEPGTLPGADGTLIKSEPVRLGISFDLPGTTGPIPGSATRMMYKSTDSNGTALAVTGTYFEPSARWAGPGPRPLVTLASGTIGQGDQCAPSRNLTTPLTITSASIAVNYELIAVAGLLAKGVAVVMTDYTGLGMSGRVHTYVNRVD